MISILLSLLFTIFTQNTIYSADGAYSSESTAYTSQTSQTGISVYPVESSQELIDDVENQNNDNDVAPIQAVLPTGRPENEEESAVVRGGRERGRGACQAATGTLCLAGSIWGILDPLNPTPWIMFGASAINAAILACSTDKKYFGLIDFRYCEI
ncbi:hypothetical protein EBR77_02710 [bacterium]|nr:hypothetical protein [bacterium]NBX78236.1 hypothetical protein [bacterium]